MRGRLRPAGLSGPSLPAIAVRISDKGLVAEPTTLADLAAYAAPHSEVHRADVGLLAAYGSLICFD